MTGGSAQQTGAVRVFVDISTTLSMVGEPVIGVARIEREIALRFSRDPNMDAIPWVFSAGRMHLLDPAEALGLLENPRTENPPIARLDATAAEQVPPVTARVQPIQEDDTGAGNIDAGVVPPAPTRPGVAGTLLASAGKQARRVLAHGRAAVLKALLPPGESPDDWAARLAAVEAARRAEEKRAGAAEQRMREAERRSNAAEERAGAEATARLVAENRLAGLTRARDAIVSRGIEIDWPRTGEIIWSGGVFGSVVPLRRIAEARANRGFACVLLCHDQIPAGAPGWNSARPGELRHDCAAADLLDAADRVVCVSEGVRARLLTYAASRGRAPPEAIVVTPGLESPAAAGPDWDTAYARIAATILDLARTRQA